MTQLSLTVEICLSVSACYDIQLTVSLMQLSTINVTLLAKTSLMLGEHKAGFRREGHKC